MWAVNQPTKSHLEKLNQELFFPAKTQKLEPCDHHPMKTLFPLKRSLGGDWFFRYILYSSQSPLSNPLFPESQQLSMVPPLSEKKKNRVFSAKFRSTRCLTTSPAAQLISAMVSPIIPKNYRLTHCLHVCITGPGSSRAYRYLDQMLVQNKEVTQCSTVTTV